MLELRGVSKTFGRQEALYPTDLRIPSGQTTVLIGPSGCGKSTLLRLLIGLTAPDAGEVLFEGTPVTPANSLPLDPAALLMDEPLGALDPLVRADLQQDLRRIFKTQNKTVVLVTHDLGEAAFFADRIVLMRAGRIVQQGTLEEMWREPADPFVRQFIQAQRGPE